MEKPMYFNHYCAKHHEWWNTKWHDDCPLCLKEEKKKTKGKKKK